VNGIRQPGAQNIHSVKSRSWVEEPGLAQEDHDHRDDAKRGQEVRPVFSVALMKSIDAKTTTAQRVIYWNWAGRTA
jgi:hypothetical protein